MGNAEIQDNYISVPERFRDLFIYIHKYLPGKKILVRYDEFLELVYQRLLKLVWPWEE